MLTSTTLLEFLKIFTADRVQSIEFVNVLQELGSIVTLSPYRSEFVWGKWRPPHKSFSNNALRRAGDRCEEVGGSLSKRTFESHVNEVFFRCMDFPKINLSTLIKDRYLIKDLQKRVIRLRSKWKR